MRLIRYKRQYKIIVNNVNATDVTELSLLDQKVFLRLPLKDTLTEMKGEKDK